MIESLEDRIAKLLRVQVDDTVAGNRRGADDLARDIENHLLQLKTELVLAVASRHKFEKEARARREEVGVALSEARLLLEAAGDASPDAARRAAARVLELRKEAATFDKLAADRVEQGEKLRSLYLELQKRSETIRNLRDSIRVQADASSAGSAADEDAVERLLEELRRRDSSGA